MRVSDSVYDITKWNIVACVGFLIGPIEIIIGLAQAALNGLAMLFSKEKTSKEYDTLKSDAYHGLKMARNGLFDCTPGTWIISLVLHIWRDMKQTHAAIKNMHLTTDFENLWKGEQVSGDEETES